MNTMARKAASSAWSVTCMLVAALLVGTFFYWLIFQRPAVEVTDEPLQKDYVATAGSIVYIESPIAGEAGSGKVDYSNVLVSLDKVQRYVLPSPEEAHQEASNATKIVPSNIVPSHPLYAVYIPTWVKPGVYDYTVTARYRLNPFKTAEVELPKMTIKVE